MMAGHDLGFVSLDLLLLCFLFFFFPQKIKTVLLIIRPEKYKDNSVISIV